MFVFVGYEVWEEDRVRGCMLGIEVDEGIVV